MKEYTDLEIMQMIGRAVSITSTHFTLFLTSTQGRPQFGNAPRNSILQRDTELALGR